jgi:hypothetical protein
MIAHPTSSARKETGEKPLKPKSMFCSE